MTDFSAIEDVPTFANRTAATFSGVIGEARYNLIGDTTHPYGLSLSFNPAYRQFDPTSIVRTAPTAHALYSDRHRWHAQRESNPCLRRERG